MNFIFRLPHKFKKTAVRNRHFYMMGMVTITILCFIFSMAGSVPAQENKEASDKATTAGMFNDTGKTLIQSGKIIEALDAFLKANELEPEAVEYASNAGVAAFMIKDYTLSARYFQKVVNIGLALKNYQLVSQYQAQVKNVLGNWPQEKMNRVAQLKQPPSDEKGAAVFRKWQKTLTKAARLLGAGKLEVAHLFTKQAVKLAEENFEPDHMLTLESKKQLAQILASQNQYQKALKIYDEVQKGYHSHLGANHPETIWIYFEKALISKKMSQHDTALTFIENTITPLFNEIGDHLKVIQARYEKAILLKEKGDTASAETELKHVLALYSSTLKEHHPDTLAVFSALAKVYEAQTRYAEAAKIYQKIEKLQAEALGQNSFQRLQTLNLLADIYRLQARYPEAEKLLDENLTKIKSQVKDDHYFVLVTQNFMANLYEDTGDYPKARELYEKIYTHTLSRFGEKHPNTVTSMTNLGNIYFKLGAFQEAEMFFDRAYQHMSILAGKKHPVTVRLMNNLGLVYENQGLFDRSEPFLQQAIQYSKDIGGEAYKKDQNVWNMLNNLALLYESQGLFSKAEPIHQELIDLCRISLGDEHPRTAANINNLGYLYLLQKEYEKALEYFEETFETWNALYGERHQATLKSLNNLGRTHHRLGNVAKAREAIEKALELRTDVLGPEHVDTIRSMHDLAVLLTTAEQNDEADKLFSRTLALSEKKLGLLHPYTFETLNHFADLKEQVEDWEAALNLRLTVFDRRNEFFSRVLWATNENARAGFIHIHRMELDALIALLINQNSPDAAQKILEISLERKGLLLKISSEIQQVVSLSKDPALTEISQNLIGRKKELASLTLSGPVDDITDEEHAQKLMRIENDIETLQGKLARKSAVFHKKISPATLNDVMEDLGEDAVAIDYFIYKEPSDQTKKVIAVSAQKQEDETYQFDLIQYGGLTILEEAVKIFREVIMDEDAEEEDLLDEAQYRYEQIWEPLLDILGEKTDIYLVPDGILNIMPFEALMDPDENYLLSTYQIKILTSLRDLIRQEFTEGNNQLVMIAGPDYDLKSHTTEKTKISLNRSRSASRTDSRAHSGDRANGLRMSRGARGMRGLNFDPLPGAEAEGRDIEALTKDKKETVTYYKKDGEEAKLRTFNEGPEILHIATHGFFLEPQERLVKRLLKTMRSGGLDIPPPGDNPLLRAGLAFAGINKNAAFLGEIDTDNDGVLTALEVLELNLQGTKVVILSACETGLGEIHEGEGVYGLRRAFQEAGASTIVNSLWEVSDAGTQKLMTLLYEEILKGLSVRDAFHEARLQMVDHYEWGHPYYWSAFFMVGL